MTADGESARKRVTAKRGTETRPELSPENASGKRVRESRDSDDYVQGEEDQD